MVSLHPGNVSVPKKKKRFQSLKTYKTDTNYHVVLILRNNPLNEMVCSWDTWCRPNIWSIKWFFCFRCVFRGLNTYVIPLLVVSYHHKITTITRQNFNEEKQKIRGPKRCGNSFWFLVYNNNNNKNKPCTWFSASRCSSRRGV